MGNNSISSRQVASAIMAIAFTFALHAGWLSGLDRDAATTIASVTVA